MSRDSNLTQLQLIVSLASAGDNEAAAEHARRIEDNASAAEAWRAIGRVNANLQRWDVARFAFRQAIGSAPFSRELRLEAALVAERAGEHDAALEELESLAGAGVESPTLLVHLARALQFAGREDDAEAQLRAGLARWPVDVPLHQQLAHLRWRRGHEDTFIELLERTIGEYPREMALRLVAADLLRNAGQSARALAMLEAGLALAPESPAFLTSVGVLLDELDRVDEALVRLRAAQARAPDSPSARRNLLPTLLRVGDSAEALRLVEGLLAQSPDDQQLIAWRATALRVAGDAEYSRLHDYQRLVRPYRLRPPAEYPDIRAFNAAFACELSELHRWSERPLTQSLRGGSQTERNLPMNDARYPAIAAFFRMLAEPIGDYLSRLDVAGHPTDRRRRSGWRVAGSWSVQLAPGGFHTNHVHPQGWLSSAYYVELPEGVGANPGDRAGWLQFGEPGMARPVCAPDHFVQPEAGGLVLFPSYVWHGTVPFSEGGRRLTAAFDVLPV